MKLFKPVLICVGCLVFAVALSSCSDVQNREKKTIKDSYNGASISLKILKRSTTSGTKTTEEFDSKLEKVITKSLTKSLINGSDDKALFSKEAFAKAQAAFVNNKTAAKNTAEVSLYHMSTNSDDDVIVAEVSQKVTSKSKVKTTHAGKIYFDKTGLIVGFDFEQATDSTTTTAKEQA